MKHPLARGMMRANAARTSACITKTIFTRKIMSANSCSLQTRNYSLSSRVLALPDHIIMPMPALSPVSSFANSLYNSFPDITKPSTQKTMEEGSIAKWNVKEGDSFEAGSSLCDVETDKASVSMDATDDGIMAKILVAEGSTIKVGDAICVVVEEIGDVAAFANFTAPAEGAVVEAPAPTPTPASIPSTPTPVAAAPAVASTPAAASTVERLFASPLARKLAREAGIDLDSLIPALGMAGSGPGGRVVASDVLIASTMTPPTTTAAPVAAAAAAAAAAGTGTGTGTGTGK